MKTIFYMFQVWNRVEDINEKSLENCALLEANSTMEMTVDNLPAEDINEFVQENSQEELLDVVTSQFKLCLLNNLKLFFQAEPMEIFCVEGSVEVEYFILNEDGTYTKEIMVEIEVEIVDSNEDQLVSPEISAPDSVLLSCSPIHEVEFIDEYVTEQQTSSASTAQANFYSSESSPQPSTSSTARIGFFSSVESSPQPRTSSGRSSALSTRGRGRPRKSKYEREAEIAVCFDDKTLRTLKNNDSSARYRDNKKNRQQKKEVELKELEKTNKSLRRQYKSDKKEVKEWKLKLKALFTQLKKKPDDQQ